MGAVLSHPKSGFSVSVPHLALPVKFLAQPDGSVAADTVEQDSHEEIHHCVEAIVRYERGQRPEQPEFGIISPVFQSGPIKTEPIREAVQAWEPRANIVIRSEISSKDELLQHLTIELADDPSGGINA